MACCVQVPLKIVWRVMRWIWLIFNPFSKVWPTNKTTRSILIKNNTSIKHFICITVSFLCLPWYRVIMWPRALCHPAVHSHSFDRWTLWPSHGEQMEVRSLLLLPVAATLVGAAGGADAVCRGPPHLYSDGWGGGGVMVRRRRGMSLGYVSWLAEVVTGRGDWLSFDVDVVVSVDGEIGWPTEKESEEESVYGLWLWSEGAT